MLKKKTLKCICGVLSFLGFMLLLGTVGAMDLDNISFSAGIVRSVIGLAAFAGFGFLAGGTKCE